MTQIKKDMCYQNEYQRCDIIDLECSQKFIYIIIIGNMSDCDIIKHIHICDQPHDHWYEQLFTRYYPYSPHNSKHLIDGYSLTHIF